jgi:hypothetical protein
MFRIIFCVLVLLGLTVPAKAWNGVGHRTIAEMVWQKMTAPERLEATELLKQHPHYKEILTADVPSGVDKDEWAFLTAATWPDMVRKKTGKPESITKYDLYPHAIGYPFMRPNETNHAMIEKFIIYKPDAEEVLSNSFITFNDKTASPHDRAVALCWSLHLCGDLHQPLHGANLVTKEHPNGDQLGGHHMVRDGHGKVVDMHRFWDAQLGVDGSYGAISNSARQIASDGKLKRATGRELKNDTTVASWVQESFRVAVQFAYQGARLPFVREDDWRSGKIADKQIPQLSEKYISEAHQVAQRRALLAAERLSTTLKKGW